MLNTIAGWTEAKLARYVQNILRSSPAQLPRSMRLEELRTTKKLIVEDQIELSPQAIGLPFVAPTLNTGWSNYNAAVWEPAGYMKDALGFVHIRGLLISTGASQNLFTLPVGLRPRLPEIFWVAGYVADHIGCRVDVHSNGEVNLIHPGSGAMPYLSIAGITFKAA